ncbi:hypothetical protein I203_101101 [Kwoniella mangroviensis CBS 8507]|uniref:uncharacterized protein n=1 Tax=Kwoniella mangroviensis CBS 8507 TaxID=1296122 RepID=UPI00080D5ECC|nr:uncharacterized protein I203_02735 [Kwoniella mangroviensis CBS 8507]OCF68076.1 hypothetical protein I203_02735 [Kwoniella mangroviensis CBS 8507]
MSAPSSANEALAAGKKRKRTGKEREERKRLAILAQQEAEKVEDVAEDSITAESSTHVAQDTSIGTGPEIRGVDVEQAIKRIPQALKFLHPTFKQAKTFETRRLIKKIKFLRTKPDTKAEVSDLEGQLKLLHDTQLHPLAQSHLLVKLRKNPSFKASSLPRSILDLLTIQETTSTSTSSTAGLVAKVENRLCSAKNVAEAVKGVVSWIVGEEGAKLVHHAKKQSKAISVQKGGLKIQDDNENEDSSEDMIEGGREMMVVGSASENEDEALEDEGLAQQEYAADEAGWESGSIGGEFDGSDEEGEEDISDEDAIPIPPSKKSKPTPAPPQSKEKPLKAEKIPKGDITSSMFLPSLAAGFTRGDEGDSDPDDDLDPNGVIGKNTKERKNRRGQRARQAIWEKKYGKGAKHVVKAKADDEAYQAAKAKREADKRGRPEHMKGRDSGWGARSGQPSIPSGSPSTPKSTMAPLQQQPPKEEKKNLHPSWEAARLRKQKMGAVPADAPKANKIVFD